jgi:hypothetical protein
LRKETLWESERLPTPKCASITLDDGSDALIDGEGTVTEV